MWGEYGARAFYQKQGLPFIGEFESQYEQYEGSTGEIRHLKEDTLENGGIVTQNQNAVGMWYDSHTQQLGQIEAFAPQLQELYDTESKLIEKYGSQEEARNSKEFKEAVQQFADATGLNETTAKKYLDYLQTEANVENARKVMQVRVDAIVAEANAEAMKALYGDETGPGGAHVIVPGDLNIQNDGVGGAGLASVTEEIAQRVGNQGIFLPVEFHLMEHVGMGTQDHIHTLIDHQLRNILLGIKHGIVVFRAPVEHGNGDIRLFRPDTLQNGPDSVVIDLLVLGIVVHKKLIDAAFTACRQTQAAHALGKGHHSDLDALDIADGIALGLLEFRRGGIGTYPC